MSSDFWSKRKAAVAAEQEAEADLRAQAEIAQEQQALEEKSDEEILAALDLPDPDTLKMGDDFSGFMEKAVPDRIRRRALRTLWRSNPTLANVDGLVEYGEDFTNSAMVVENLQTAYQVGKGMLSHVLEMAKQADAEDEPVEEAEEVLLAEIVSDDDHAEPVETVGTEEPSEPTQPETDEGVAGVTMDDTVALPRRRMKFEFEEA